MDASTFINQDRARPLKLSMLVLLAGLVATTVTGQSSRPLVDLAAEPLYMNGSKTKGNLTIALSVDAPSVGQAHRGGHWSKGVYSHANTYNGYFNADYCYKYISTASNSYFDEQGPATDRRCGGSGYSGNFMNWATASSMDILRMGLTGGNRVVDGATGDTILERAWLPDSFYRRGNNFSQRFISKSDVSGLVDSALHNVIPTSGLWIYNCKNRVYFANAEDKVTLGAGSNDYWNHDTYGDCNSPFNTSATATSHPNLLGPTGSRNWWEVRVKVCDAATAKNRLMKFDVDTKRWSGLCLPYPNGKYKPVGQLQVNADNARVAVFSYLKDNGLRRYGGVLRSPLKYLGPNHYDANFNLINSVNPRREWDVNTGIFVASPHGDELGDNLGISGAMNYINKYGTLGPTSNWGIYAYSDPVSELYYEALRYLQGKPGPSPQAIVGIQGSTSSAQSSKDFFPAYHAYTDPFTDFVDSTGDAKSCLRNTIVTVSDAFTWSDRSVPGNTLTPHSSEFARPADTDPPLDVPFWTSVVGSFESKTSASGAVSYVDSKGRTQRAYNLPGWTPLNPAPSPNRYPSGPTSLEFAATMDTGAKAGSYYMAGMAYWANTQAFHPAHTKARIKTYAIDVNEEQASSTHVNFRRTRAQYLAAKYGGFDDHAADNTGNPFSVGNNSLWERSDGDARNYYLARDADKLMIQIAEVFQMVAEETGNISGGAVSTQRVTAAAAGAVFQARFNPVANFWSGRVMKNTITAGTDTIVLNPTPEWEAAAVLTAATNVDHGASRKIVIGPAAGRSGLEPATAFQWGSLSLAHQTALGTLNGVPDTLGPDRLDFLRGDRRMELTGSNPLGNFRPRDYVLGDVVNSGLIYMDRPNPKLIGSTDSSYAQASSYRTFVKNMENRKKVVLANANDGMLHAFDADTGAEVFAYVPGFISSKLSQLPQLEYSHKAFADATPVVSEAYINGSWRTALVSGVGGGGQGVYALDVSNPSTFTTTNALWEFTDRDHPAMGNVLGAPQILKFRVQNKSAAGTHSYKTFAVVASGVNNYALDGYAHASGAPSIFLLDMAHVPSPTNPWAEGVNFWRIELPQSEASMAAGLVGFNSLTEPDSRVVTALFAADLQGNLWKLDFSQLGVNSSNLGASASLNFQKFNALTNDAPLYVARTAGNVRQPLTGTPEIVNAYFGKKLIVFGSGKYLEVGDTSVPSVVGSSLYAVLDDPLTPVPNRAALQQGTVAAGTVTVPTFTLGAPATTSPNVKSGWFVDLEAAIGERQVSDISTVGNRLYLSTLYPTRGSCGEGGGRIYSLDSLKGAGYSVESQVGVLAAPLVVRLGSPTAASSTTSGRRQASDQTRVISQGAKGLQATTISDGQTYQSGRLAWRLVNNYPVNVPY